MRKEIYEEETGNFIGVITKETVNGKSWWSCYPANRDLGHGGMDTEKEAEEELQKMYNEGKRDDFEDILATVQQYVGNSSSTMSFEIDGYRVHIEITTGESHE